MRLSTPRWLLALVGLIAVAGLTAGLWATFRSNAAHHPHAGYGGSITITFVSTAAAADRASVMSTCGSLPGVTATSMNPDGTGSITGPPAGESGVSKATLALHQVQRQRIYACLKGSRFVASTLEGL
jgi:hypothetical protein